MLSKVGRLAVSFRITYSVLDADLEALHRELDGALARVRSNLGSEHPCWVNGNPIRTRTVFDNRNPANTQQLLGHIHAADHTMVEAAVAAARTAQRDWGRRPWQERVAIVRDAAERISERRLEAASIMMLETGKNRLESLGDVEEAAELLRYYAAQLEEADGYARPLGRLSSNENTRDVLKPFGVFAVISPFNFPLALPAGMSSAALLGGNAVILKPSEETPMSAEFLYFALRDAGVPDGVFQVLHGTGEVVGRSLVQHGGIDGVAFTGSRAVGLEIHRALAREYIKPALLELGGKNAAVVCRHADLDAAAEGCVRSAFGLSGQKCSALSRLIVDRNVKEPLLDRIRQRTAALKIGDPTERDVFVGPVINADAVQRYVHAAQEARHSGVVHAGADRPGNRTDLESGYYVLPTVAELPRNHRLTQDELFLPFLTVETFDELHDAVARVNALPYGLTGGVFSERPEDVEYFMDHAEAGVLYANRRTGATTGAWPGVQSFCGWKGSGSTGKGGCGPYYVAQFMREQSQTRMQ
jgi:1-pyrroline-5-carboxylate dehydrogenase